MKWTSRVSCDCVLKVQRPVRCFRLSELVDPPRVVKEVSWVSTLWPEDVPDEMVPERPEVQKYCLMGVKDSFTDFHIDFGGTSVWYHVLRVSGYFCWSPLPRFPGSF